MTLRLRPLLLATLATCLLWSLGGIGPVSAAWGLGLGGSPKTAAGVEISQIPTTTMFVPRRSPLAASLLTKDLSVLRSRLNRSGSQADWQNFQNSFLADADLRFGRDVKPWLGENLTLAVTTPDLDHRAANGNQPGYLLAVAVKDPERAREFLQRYWQRRAADGSVLRYERVSGVRLIYSEPGRSGATEADGFQVSQPLGPSADPAAQDDHELRAMTSALVGDRFLLFANAPKVIREAVASVQSPELNLASDRNYQRSLAALTAPRLAYAYANLSALGSWLETQGLAVSRSASSTEFRAELATSPVDSPTAVTPAPSRYQGFAVGLGATSRGFLADAALLSPEQSPKTVEAEAIANAQPAQPAQVLSYLPPDSIAAVSSTSLNQVWQGIQPLLTTYPALGTLVNRALENLQASWQLDITREIFPWVNGEYGLGQLERPEGTDWVFVVERTPTAVQQGIKHLDELARKQGYSIGEVTLADHEVTAWTSLNPAGEQASAASAVRAIVRGVHTQLDDYELFSTSLEAMEKVLQARQGSALTESRLFQRAIAPLPKNNQGYLYVNWKNNRAILQEELPLLRILELTAQPLLRGLQTVSLSGYDAQPKAGLQRVAIAFQLDK